jgi:hypothetical protein
MALVFSLSDSSRRSGLRHSRRRSRCEVLAGLFLVLFLVFLILGMAATRRIVG